MLTFIPAFLLSRNEVIIISLCVSFGVVILITLITLFLHLHKKYKIKKSDQSINEKIHSEADQLIQALGGKDNIKEVKVMGSRVRVTLHDFSKANRDQILTLHNSVLFMNDKITFVIGTFSEHFAKSLTDN